MGEEVRWIGRAWREGGAVSGGGWSVSVWRR